jgi:hypothetical protein
MGTETYSLIGGGTMKKMILSFVAGIVFTVAVLLLFNLASPASGAMPQRYPEMRGALRHLEQARDNLSNAAHDFHGHRAKALEHTNKAIDEVNKAIASGE